MPWDSAVDKLNHQNKLYIYSIKTADYHYVKTTSKEHFVYTDVIYAFMSYYPLPGFFFKLMTSLIKFSRDKRKDHLMSKFMNIDYSKLDLAFVLATF